MTAIPLDWFEVLEVDPEDVARVGYSLAEYAREFEAPDPEQPGEVTVERVLLLATTLTDAATLLVVIDQGLASDLLAQGATLYESVGAPEAWTLGLASNGSWRPSRSRRNRWPFPRPSEAISSLAALYYDQEVRLGNPRSPWRAASAFREKAGLGWSLAGVPASMFAEFVAHARERNFEGMVRLLDRIVERVNESIRFAQELDSGHWRKFLADVPLIDLEIVALGCVAARVDDNLVDQVRDQELSPARVALLVSMGISADPSPERHFG